MKIRLTFLFLLPALLTSILPLNSPSDPVFGPALLYRVEWATRLGGSESEDLRELLLLPDGSLLLGGQTMSADFPVTDGVIQPKYGGEPAGTGHPGMYGGDCYIARLSPDGRRLMAATFFGGSKQERSVYGMGLDRQGNIVITTTTRSRNMPTTGGAFQRKFGGGEADVVVAKLSSDLKKLIWCTYIGGKDDDSPRGGLTLDEQDNIYVAGNTKSSNFPTTPGVIGPKPKGDHDGFIVKLKPDGSGLVWSTFLGGRGRDGVMGIQVDGQGKVFMAGHTESDDFPVNLGAAQPKRGGKSDCFITSLSPDAKRLLYATYLGGRENEFAEYRLGILKEGSVLLTGMTSSGDFPTTPGAFRRTLRGKSAGFLTRLSNDGRTFVFSTLLGGAEEEFFLMPNTDAEGNIFIVGQTSSKDFPLTPGALQNSYGGNGDGVLAVLNPDASRLVYATYLGGEEEDLIRSFVVGRNGEIYLAGKTASRSLAFTTRLAPETAKPNQDAFVIKLVQVK